MKRRNKYGAIKCELDGYKFDSKRERDYYCELKIREKAGEISVLEVHPTWAIHVNYMHVCQYTADFSFYDDLKNGHWRVVDIKSEPTAKKRDFVIVRKLMKACYGIDVEVVK